MTVSLGSIVSFHFNFNIKAIFVLQVHINLLLLESRLQAELLYALRAIMKYMT